MPAGDWVVLTVADTGTGVADDALDRLFEPFFTTKEVGTGTGLGLAQVYGIVKQHEGFISVKRDPGKGAAFTVYLPANAERERPSIAGATEAGGLPRGMGKWSS